MKLREILPTYTVDMLKPLARLCNSPSLMRKDDIITGIIGTLTSPEGLRLQWEQLDDLSRKAVAQAVHNSGEFDEAAFRARYGQLPVRPQSRWTWEKQAVRLDLFLYQDHIPDEMLPLLEPWVPRPEPFQIEGVTATPRTVKLALDTANLLLAETERVGPQDLAAFLHLVDSGGMQVASNTQMPSVGSLKKLWPLLGVRDFLEVAEGQKTVDTIRPVGLAWFAVQGGLASGYDKLTLTEAGQAWLRTQDPALLLAAFEQWEQSDRLDELSRVRALRGQSARRTTLTKPSLRRQRIVEALSWCPPGVWIDIEEFFRAVVIWQLDPQIEATGFANLYVGSSREYGTLYYGNASYWRIVHGLYILAVLWETLATIGALDIAYLLPEEAIYDSGLAYGLTDGYLSLYDGLQYFRINKLGAYLLGQADEYASPARTRPPFLRVEAPTDGSGGLIVRITAPELTTPADTWALDLFARRIDERTYYVDRDSLLGALEDERDLPPALAYLLQWHDGPLPAEMIVIFDDAIARGQAFEAPVPSLTIKVESADLARQIAQDSKLKQFCKLSGDRILVIPASRERAFRNRLREIGYVLPK